MLNRTTINYLQDFAEDISQSVYPVQLASKFDTQSHNFIEFQLLLVNILFNLYYLRNFFSHKTTRLLQIINVKSFFKSQIINLL